MSEPGLHPSICRFCTVGCPVMVEVAEGRAVRVSGNRNSPTYFGFCCAKGQAAPEQLAHPDRLLTSQKRDADGVYRPISAEQAMDEVAAQIRRSVDQWGPDSVAIYVGTYSACYPAVGPFAGALLEALGSRMMFSPNTIDQPGKDIAAALLGGWEAGPQMFTGSDVWLVVGGNPLVSYSNSLPGQNPARRLTDALRRGMKLIVIDPRRTETAARAHIHLQPRPGEDAAILAGMIRIILTEGLEDAAFLAENVAGLDALRAMVEPFTPALVCARAGLAEADLIAAARTFARGPRGLAVGVTGINFSGRSSLAEYLVQVLNTICGRFIRAGEPIVTPGVLLPRAAPRAQPRPPRPARDLGYRMASRGLGASAAGLPTAAAAEEMLAGRIKVLISIGGNPVAAWPDHPKVLAGLEALDLFVQVDIRMSAAARLAHHVIAAKAGFEVPTASVARESLERGNPVHGNIDTFGMYAPALVEPPPGSDLVEEWEFLYGLAQRLGLPLSLRFPGGTKGTARESRPPINVDMAVRPSSDAVLEMLTAGSRIPLAEVKAHPDGALFPEEVLAAPKSPDCTARMQVGDAAMMAELAEVLAEPDPVEEAFPFLLVSRRMAHVYNSSGHDLPLLRRKGTPFNPAFIHPDDLAALGVEPGDRVVVASRHGEVEALAEADPSLRRGVIAMTHAFGGLPGDGTSYREVGSNIAALMDVADGFDRHSGIPRMSGLAVRVTVGPPEG
ncbi:molybdopterin-dependent oxidoreductase [Novosphingobium bradum]|uniref:Molybdopterin-dependent oxidoreductase n=1 Tax=Novosphingobium bradum TaxID=1737444 RepID=A0ABV7IQH4_9SPHN